MPSGIQADEAQHDCQRWSRKLPWEVEQIDPDIIVVLAGGGDLSNRRMPDWPDFLNPGDAVFDDWLVAEMIAVTDRLSAHGAHVAWLNWPCTDGAPRRSRWVGTQVFDLERANHLNQVLLPRVRAARPDTVSIIDLFSLVCPGGEFTHELAGLENARQDGVHLYRPEALWISGLIVPEMITAAAR